ncbi:MAG: hypothetical protein U0175_25665 [Caldilineaceae bacterium]
MFNPTRGSARELIDRNEVARLRAANALLLDGRMRRPYYFDGRFLTAQDLTREQNYFLSRQADLGRANGFGVVSGLDVSISSSTRGLRISAGHGVTPLGELVLLTDPLEIDLLDLPTMQRLNAAFGLATIPKEIARNRTGLFIVALRPVEYTANPIGSYPTSISGKRTVEDGDIVEAVAISLIPYQDSGTPDENLSRRSEIARRIFVEQEAREFPAGVLPIAMIALNRGTIDWVDPYLVRREVGAEQQDILGLGYAPRALREAHVQQFNAQMAEIVAAAAGDATKLKFAAAEQFRCLPPVGRIPLATVATDFTQTFFPPEVNVDLSIVPQDELPMLIEEALTLPPIDLTLAGDEQESTSVLLLAPMTRAEVHRLSLQLEGKLTFTLRSPAPLLVASRKPLDVLRGIRLPRPTPLVLDPSLVVDAPWRTALTATDTIWYVRRRNLNYFSAVVGIEITVQPENPSNPVEPPPAPPNNDGGNGNPTPDNPPPDNPPPPAIPEVLTTRLASIGIREPFEALFTAAPADAQTAMVDLLLLPQVAASNLFTTAAINDLGFGIAGPVDAARVAQVAKRFGRADLGDGMDLLAKGLPALRKKDAVTNLTVSGAVPELDGVGRLILQIQKRLESTPTIPPTKLEQTVKPLMDELLATLSANGLNPTGDALVAHRRAMALFVRKATTALRALLQ